jgi:ribonuclease P protein component
MGDARKRGRLSRSGDFDRVYRDGRSHSNRFLVLYAFPREEDDETADSEPDVRLGVSVSRKVGGAVERNRARRRLREAVRRVMPDHAAGRHDYVVIARKGTLDRPFERLLDDLVSALKRLDAWRPAP